MYLPPEAYKAFEPHISELVRALHGMGLSTESSCEGHLTVDRQPYPQVMVNIGTSACLISPRRFLREFFGLLAEWGNGRNGREWSIVPVYVQEDGGHVVFDLEPVGAERPEGPGRASEASAGSGGAGGFLGGEGCTDPYPRLKGQQRGASERKLWDVR